MNLKALKLAFHIKIQSIWDRDNMQTSHFKLMNLKAIITVLFLFISGISYAFPTKREKAESDTIIAFDDTRKIPWAKEFRYVEIESSIDKKKQEAYFYKTTSVEPQPLVVSLHTWSGTYAQIDSLSTFSKDHNYNYIHPNFRGVNNSPEACGSPLTISDIDDSIDFAIKNGNVDINRIFVIGVSGGGYATLNTFMHSKHKIKKFSSWAAISDLTVWYDECTAKGYKYAQHIYISTNSEKGYLNIPEAKKRSPIYAVTPLDKLRDSKITIYAGVHDGIQGSVPFTHSIHFYNKLLKDLQVSQKHYYVSDKEIKKLIKHRKPLKNFGKIQDREVCLIKTYNNIKLVIFTGGHEMLSNYAFKDLID